MANDHSDVLAKVFAELGRSGVYEHKKWLNILLIVRRNRQRKAVRLGIRWLPGFLGLFCFYTYYRAVLFARLGLMES